MSIRPNLLDFHPAALRTQRARLPASLFRTHDLPPAERYAAWRESIGVFLDSNLHHSDDAARFDGAVESYLLDDLVLSRPAAMRQKFDRPSARIARDGIDHYMIQLFVRGHAEINIGRRVIEATPHHIAGFDLADVLDSFNSDFDILCVVVPRSRLAPLLARPDSLHTALPQAGDGAGALLAGFLRNLFDTAPDLLPAQAGQVAQALVELIAVAFNGARCVGGELPQTARRALSLDARMRVRQRVAEPALDPDEIAAMLGVSRSVLYRLFEECGGVAAYIREQRLRRCHADLVSRRGAGLQVAEIAYRWGFTDAAHFTRLFRRRFGCSPSDARQGAAARRIRDGIDTRVGDRRYEDWIAGLA